MRLNMWQIANRLDNYTIEYQINPNAEPVLNGVLPIYMPDCVQLKQEGNNVLCYHEQGYIRIFDINVSECYMLLQSIFNWYQIRIGAMTEALRSGDYPRFVQEVSWLHGNPVMLLDSNYQLLGIAENNVAPPEVHGWGHTNKSYIRPPEWEYIVEHGQSSMEGYALMSKLLQKPLGSYYGRVYHFAGVPGSRIPYGGIHTAIRYHGEEYAKITILNVNRTMNIGDFLLMRHISHQFAVYCAAGPNVPSQRMDAQFLKQLLTHEPPSQERIAYFEKEIFSEKHGQALLFVVEYIDHEKRDNMTMLRLLKNAMAKRYPRLISCCLHNTLVCLLSSPFPSILAGNCFSFLNQEGYSGQIRSGISLPFESLSDIASFYTQARYAMQFGDTEKPGDFYNVATKYVMANPLSRECIYACEPNLRKMWFKEPSKRNYLLTLQTYLEFERSNTLAADHLFIHKNTLSYRIRYLQQCFDWNLDNPNIRNYLQISLYILKYYSED